MKSLSRVRLLVTPWTAAHQAPLSMDFPGKRTGVGGIAFSVGENGYLYMCGESLCCPPDAITTLLAGYTPVPDKKFNK